MIGKTAQDEFATSPTAAYPEATCEFVASIIFVDWIGSLDRDPPYGGGVPTVSAASTSRTVKLTPRARSAEGGTRN